MDVFFSDGSELNDINRFIDSTRKMTINNQLVFFTLSRLGPMSILRVILDR